MRELQKSNRKRYRYRVQPPVNAVSRKRTRYRVQPPVNAVSRKRTRYRYRVQPPVNVPVTVTDAVPANIPVTSSEKISHFREGARLRETTSATVTVTFTVAEKPDTVTAIVRD